jgi:hypothetical protein
MLGSANNAAIISNIGAKTAGANETAIVDAATDAAAGKVELAIASEINTGTDAARAVTPDALAGSNFGIRTIEVMVFGPTTPASTGDGKIYFVIPPAFNGMNIVNAYARVITAGTTNTLDIQLRNVTDAVDVFSTKLTIDSTEVSSTTAASAVVINASNDDVASHDLFAIDIDAVHTTPSQGLIVYIQLQLP